MHKIPPNISGVRSRLPTAPTEERLPTENINNTFPDRIIPNKKIFGQYTSRHENKTAKFPGERRNNTLKSISCRQRQSANHYVIPTLEEFDYDSAVIHLSIDDVLQSKDMSELEDPPKK